MANKVDNSVFDHRFMTMINEAETVDLIDGNIIIDSKFRIRITPRVMTLLHWNVETHPEVHGVLLDKHHISGEGHTGPFSYTKYALRVEHGDRYMVVFLPAWKAIEIQMQDVHIGDSISLYYNGEIALKDGRKVRDVFIVTRL